jgi:hypothetical protein
MAKPKEYLHIRAWGNKLLSYEYYIKDQQELAASQNAPIDAIYKKNGEPGWVCASELSDDLRAELSRRVNEQA